MTISPFDSALYGNLLSDPEYAPLFSDAASIRAMLDVEAALARVQGRIGIIPAKAAGRIEEAATRLNPDPDALAPGTGKAGVPIPSLVDLLRDAVGDDAADFVHWGATSQDILDSALMLRLKAAVALFDNHLTSLCQALAYLADRHRHTVMVGRTRSQQATVTTFGLKTAQWLAPLLRNRDRLCELTPRLLVLSLGGASGNMGVLGSQGPQIAKMLADELGLTCPDLPWHNQRDNLVEFANWLSVLSGSLGKMGTDILTMAQTEVAELSFRSAGGSSTMPQKANPVPAELLVALARFNAGRVADMHHALLHGDERDGAAWTLEWLTLPQMVVATGRSLKIALESLPNLVINTDRMRANLDAGRGLPLAEAATFALARHMPRSQALRLVKKACRDATASGSDLLTVLKQDCGPSIDVTDLSDPLALAGPVDQLIDAVISKL